MLSKYLVSPYLHSINNIFALSQTSHHHQYQSTTSPDTIGEVRITKNNQSTIYLDLTSTWLMMKRQTPVSPKPVLVMMEERSIKVKLLGAFLSDLDLLAGGWLALSFHFQLGTVIVRKLRDSACKYLVLALSNC